MQRPSPPPSAGSHAWRDSPFVVPLCAIDFLHWHQGYVGEEPTDQYRPDGLLRDGGVAHKNRLVAGGDGVHDRRGCMTAADKGELLVAPHVSRRECGGVI